MQSQGPKDVNIGGTPYFPYELQYFTVIKSGSIKQSVFRSIVDIVDCLPKSFPLLLAVTALVLFGYMPSFTWSCACVDAGYFLNS